MTSDQRCIARVMFANQVFKANGFAFQQLFCDVQRGVHGQAFVNVRPQGAIGDQGNDGYLPAAGHYFQVYGPVDPEEKITTAADKLEDDFGKLKKGWGHDTPLRAYSFVFNDKYLGVFTRLAQALGRLGTANPGVSCLPYTAAHLTYAFLGLAVVQMEDILGRLPDPTRVQGLDYGALREVVGHIALLPARAVASRWGDLPELGDKIRLNGLGPACEAVLRTAARRAGRVDDYFSKNASYTKQSLKDHLIAVYQPIRDRLRTERPPPGASVGDLVLMELRNTLLPPNATTATEDALDVLLGYYFEACDVFDPHADRGVANASP